MRTLHSLLTILLLAAALVGPGLATGARAQDSGRGILWNDDVVAAYRTALAQHKPLVVVLARRDGPWCQATVREVLTHRLGGAYAGDAVFSVAYPEEDSEARRMAEALGVERYPYTAVFDVSADGIRERGSVRGWHAPADFYDSLAALLRR